MRGDLCGDQASADQCIATRSSLVTAARPLFKRLAESGFHLYPDLVAAVFEELGEN
jgi:hypothetical protein